MVTKGTALASAAAAGLFGMMFAGQAPAATSTGADAGTTATNPDTATLPTDSGSTDSGSTDSGSAVSGSTDSESPNVTTPIRATRHRVVPRTAAGRSSTPVLRAPVTPPVTAPAPVTHHVRVRSGGS
jgi:hypothetical protein